MEVTFKKGDEVAVTIGGRKGENGIVTEIREGVKYSVQVMFAGQTVSTPYAVDELNLIKSANESKNKKIDPVKMVIGFLIAALLFGYALLTVSIDAEHKNETLYNEVDKVQMEADTIAKPLSDTVARIPNETR